MVGLSNQRRLERATCYRPDATTLQRTAPTLQSPCTLHRVPWLLVLVGPSQPLRKAQVNALPVATVLTAASPGGALGCQSLFLRFGPEKPAVLKLAQDTRMLDRCPEPVDQALWALALAGGDVSHAKLPVVCSFGSILPVIYHRAHSPATKMQVPKRPDSSLATVWHYAPQRMERAMGFEPTTSCLGSKHSTTELRPPAGADYSLIYYTAATKAKALRPAARHFAAPLEGRFCQPRPRAMLRRTQGYPGPNLGSESYCGTATVRLRVSRNREFRPLTFQIPHPAGMHSCPVLGPLLTGRPLRLARHVGR